MLSGTKKLGTEKIFLISVLAVIAIALIVFLTISPKKAVPEDKTLKELRNIVEGSVPREKYSDTSARYSKLTGNDVQNSKNAGLIPPDASDNVYILDYIDPAENIGTSFFVDLENKKVLKTQVVVGVGG